MNFIKETVLAIARLTISVVICVFILAALTYLFSKIPIVDWLDGGVNRDYSLQSQFAGYTIIILTAVYIGSIMLRVLARVFPLEANRSRRRVLIALLFFFAISIMSPVIIALWPDKQADLARARLEQDLLDNPAPEDVFDGRAMALGVDFMGTAVISIFGIYAFVIITIPLIFTVIRHIRPNTENSVLFLRRFSGRGDDVLTPVILQTLPRKFKVAFIASPAYKTTSWDPFVLIFAGFRWYLPWSNVPIFLKSTDERWQNDVRDLITSARGVIIDVTDRSESMIIEQTMIQALGSENRTLALYNIDAGHNLTNTSLKNRLIPYEISWRYGMPRIIIGTLILVVLGYVSFGEISLNIVGGIIGVILAIVLFVRPSLTSSSKKKLRYELNKILL